LVECAGGVRRALAITGRFVRVGVVEVAAADDRCEARSPAVWVCELAAFGEVEEAVGLDPSSTIVATMTAAVRTPRPPR
jgi:hypothetical protein